MGAPDRPRVHTYSVIMMMMMMMMIIVMMMMMVVAAWVKIMQQALHSSISVGRAKIWALAIFFGASGLQWEYYMF